MRTCPYCGKEYPDNLLFCPVDQRALIDKIVHRDNADPPPTSNPSRKKRVRAAVASLAFLPLLILVLANRHVWPEDFLTPVITGCVIFHYPAFCVLFLFETFKVSAFVYGLTALVLMIFWSVFMAWIFWKIVGTFQGEDEPDATRGQYDWAGFRVRFVIGFVIGFLCGWRFVKNAKTVQTVWIASFITGLIGGLLYGLSHPPDFWSRS